MYNMLKTILRTDGYDPILLITPYADAMWCAALYVSSNFEAAARQMSRN